MGCKKDVLREDVYDEAYSTTKNLIYEICWMYKKWYGGEFEDWLGEAHVVFMESIANHDNSKTIFQTWYNNRWYVNLNS